MTDIIADSVEARERAGRSVAAGGVIAFRTDTFYGLGANPFDAAAVAAVNELKGREGKPILVLVATAEDAARLIARTSRAFDALAARHWPGALTLVAEARAELPALLTAGTGTIGVRLPADEHARAVVRASGGALTATSANPAGLPPARNAEEAARYFPDGLALVIDGGPSLAELPSTVLEVTGERPRLIREGVVTRSELEETLRAEGFGALSVY
ncbi:MAG TPA: L-threonylcarbamoyladenylate synthase [Pyrinomonadaceae bacterium]|nr:L-threonylcarbamoyladenylate synthase [Pyrinomonadaceae bacterium]